MRLRNSSLLKWLLVTLFMFHYMSGAFFTHVHIEGSQLVTHSHPYSNAQHQHSSADFSLIRSLSFAVTIAFAMVFASVFRHVMQIVVFKRDLFDYIRFYNPLAPLRAPPSC
ncbi:MAG: hypothetical protein KAZ12_03670 [Paludibacteraceae bacterium]|nr:hypothetical protein [Paludibacteraceae bacterium]